MNTTIKYMTITALILGTVVTNGCVGRRNGRAPSVGTKPDDLRGGKSGDYDRLLKAGELMLTPTQFPLAYTIFEKAANEGNEPEAKFYLKLLAPMMKLKGIFVRIRPLVRRDGNIAQFERQIAEMPASPTKDFFLDARRGDIVSLSELQTLIEQMRDDYVELYSFLRDDPSYSFAVDFGNWVGVGPRLRQATGADRIAMRQLIAGIALYMTITTMYDLEGAQDLFNRKASITDKELFKRLQTDGYYGLGRAKRRPELVKLFAADFASAWQFAMNQQRALCFANRPQPLQRPDRLFEEGICVSTDAKTINQLNILNQMLSGSVQIEMNDWRGGTRLVEVDPLQFFDKSGPINRFWLASYFPNSFNSCGSAIGFADPSWNGVFPRNEANILLDPNRCPN